MNIKQALLDAGVNTFAVELLSESILKSPLAKSIECKGEPLRFFFPIVRSDCPNWIGVDFILSPAAKGTEGQQPTFTWIKTAELIELRALEVDAIAYRNINTPEIHNFGVAIEREAMHQRERWGSEHDAGKRNEDWIALLIYLLGKATKAHYERDSAKLLHHVITTAATCLNWHAALTGSHNRMRPGMASNVDEPEAKGDTA